MADPEQDHGFVYDNEGLVDVLRSPFFVINWKIDQSVEDYVNRIFFSLTTALDEHRPSLTALFKHVEIGMENIREKVIAFLKEKVFPLKAELLKPQVEMERRVTDLVKKSLQDVTGAEFKMFVDFLKSFSIFGDNAPPERIQELIEVIEGQADLDAQFNVSDVDHIDRMISCMFMALPIFVRGASSSRFINYFNKHIIPVFDKLPEERKLDFLKSLAGSSPYATAQDSRQLLPAIVQLLKCYNDGHSDIQILEALVLQHGFLMLLCNEAL
ncbi:hypothetical protein MA16_Dca008960 [Dendrobium catenatum]|uniref:Apoptosis inhibitor 5 n=1 Tax=Dendrobium catenatum TaxID=906689 RepID=A0A2I0WRN9_9ASPA|nr:hypothetical protein MA16_Dca008960 [Dendrobium catenatum]